MKKVDSLRDVIKFNDNFKTAINLYLNLNKPEKVLEYIPTRSSLNLLDDYMKTVLINKEQATLLIGPYGKGKSHLLLVLVAVLSMDRTEENNKVISALIEKVRAVDEMGMISAEYIEKLWVGKKFLPVLVDGLTGDLNQAFLFALNEALKREGLTGLAPDTYFSVAIERIEDWENNYFETYSAFEKELIKYGYNMSTLRTELKLCLKEALNLFTMIYPKVTSGSAFNPMAVSEVLPLYKNTSEKLVEEYGYGGIYIVFDEFSKFIEGQDGGAVGMNMKLLQDISELATESQHAPVFFTMVAHKSIKEYGKYLSTDIINSFTGIEGRIIEKYFVTSSKNNYELIRNAIIKNSTELEKVIQYEKLVGKQALEEYFQLPAFKSNFSEKDFESIILKGCYPLNPISAYLLLNVSEKVAQNERTLFTFISNDEPHSMARFIKEHSADQDWSIGADLIYDYFETLFKKDISNEFIHNIWLSTEYVLEKCKTEDQKKLIKALAIILVVNKEDEIPANEKYLSLCVNVSDSVQAVAELIGNQLIYRKSATGTFAFKTRAGSELKTEIKRQREIKGENINFSKAFANVTGKYYVIPRKYNALHSMTRYFTNEFMSVEEFLSIGSAEALFSDLSGDGKVITLYSFTGIKQEQVKKHCEKLDERRLVIVCPKKGFKGKKQLGDFEIIQELRDNQVFINNNEILKKELPLLLDDLTSELENIVASVYEEDPNTRVLYLDGGKVKNAKAGNEESAVNTCCENVYYKTPIINNEMVNRSCITTTQTKKARLNVIQAILEHKDDEVFYTGSSQEATVYRALFTVTNLLENRASDELNEVIAEMNMFIESCCDVKTSVKPLMDKMTREPYGLRLGIVPMYFAYVLANRREDIIIYFADKEVQLSADIVVNMCEYAEDYAIYVSKEDLQKERYINELNGLFCVDDNRNLSANRIKNIVICMQRWFRALAQASRNLIAIEDYVHDEKMIVAMKVIKKSMQEIDINPFEILFVTFPKEVRDESLEETFKTISACKAYYDGYFDWIQLRATDIIYNLWGGRRKQTLFHILSEWYEKQSNRSKRGLYNGRMTNFMSCIEGLSVYNDTDVAMKVAKAVTDVYMENWNGDSIVEFMTELKSVKKEIEAIRDDVSAGELTLSFVGRNGHEITKLYSHTDESTGSVLRNIIEDTLDEYDDLSVNDRVSILLDMIERIIK